MIDRVAGTEGYAEQAAELVASWQRLAFTDRPREVLGLFPGQQSLVLDVGAGIGVDAAGLAAMGHHIVAVEPVQALRDAGRSLHQAANIEWVDDALPHLRRLASRIATFDLVLLSAVWMDLNETERQSGMKQVTSLLRMGGRMIMSLRHGPIPQGRRMFAVTADETIELAAEHGLRVILRLEAASVQPSNQSQGVTWTHLGFDKKQIVVMALQEVGMVELSGIEPLTSSLRTTRSPN
jgi:protein-L-isoaspartate O-methyltransferase